ncbi:MAG: T9SS type A sorting domain-containing protein [Bacteroidetes bacterium]|nr:T9SS type A sorting domain-containing protein [Bacteroidota bacterium]
MNRRRHGVAIQLLLWTLLCASFASSQPVGYKDRLARMRDVVDSKELVMIWGQGPNTSSQSSYQRIFDLDLTQPGGVDSALVRKPLQIDSAIVGNRRLSVAAGNFLGGAVKHFVAAWAGPENTVTVVVPDIQAGTLAWTNANRLTVPGVFPSGVKRKIHVATGDFTGDRQDEFVLAYPGADTTIHLQVYSFNPGSLVPQPRGSIHDASLILPFTNLSNWDITTGDFDGDGYHDIALLYVKPLAGSNWALTANIYSVDEQGDLVSKGSQEVFQRPPYQISDINIVGATGDFDADAALEIAFGFSFFQGEQSGPDTYVYLLDVRDALTTIVAADSCRILRDEVGPNDMKPFDVDAGDLNRDGRDEIVLMSGQTFYVYSVNSHRVPEFRAQRTVGASMGIDYSDSFLAVGDMDADRRAEIVVAGIGFIFFPVDGTVFHLEVFSIDSSLATFTLKARRQYEQPVDLGGMDRTYAIALGDFDGDRTRLGEPVHYRKTGVMQPTVVLYTPPTHFDIFDTTIVDLTGCYPGQACGFSSSYVISTSGDTTVTTETHEDWGADASLLIQNPAWSISMESTYGEKFSRQASSTRSTTITTGRLAAGDDWIYANVYDIDLFEYPVYDGANPSPVGHFLVSVPGTPRPLWIESKDEDVLGNLFRPDHEVGNVLSYPLAPGLDTSRIIVNFDEQTIGSTGGSFVKLEQSTFQENSVESSWDSRSTYGFKLGSIGEVGVGTTVGVGVEVEVSVSFPIGVEAGISGSYGEGQISTQTVRVGQSLLVQSDLGHIHAQYGTSGTYHVKPYAYWTSYGALALDYRVSPLPTGGNSFWQAWYGGKPDLTFSLPWRHDLYKGLPFPKNDASYVSRTRDIFLSSTEPHGGDTVAIYARIRNLGLEAVSTPFTVRRFKGDPSAGGTQLGAVTVDTAIASRSQRIVKLPWAIPLAETLQTVRIYAVIDQEDAIANEVHETNNIGWAPAIALGGTLTSVQPGSSLPRQFVLHPSYPNPFNPMTTIQFELPSSARVLLKVFNMLGQEVATLADEVMDAGSHRVRFNAGGLASGVYVYRLDATPSGGAGMRQVAMGKAVLVK